MAVAAERRRRRRCCRLHLLPALPRHTHMLTQASGTVQVAAGLACDNADLASQVLPLQGLDGAAAVAQLGHVDAARWDDRLEKGMGPGATTRRI